jgi:hypothetical protein
MDNKTTLADLLALNLHEYEEEVKNIVDQGVKEMSMEKVLKELNGTWSSMEFEKEIHPRTNCTVIRASEELIETLEENQVHCNKRNPIIMNFVIMKVAIFWVVVPCSLVEVCQHFRGPFSYSPL